MQILLRLLPLFVVVLGLAAPGKAASPPASNDWSRVAKIEPGKRIVVKMHEGMGKAVKGSFVSSDANTITVLTKDGETKTLPWESVRKIKPKRKWTGMLVGIATGAAIAGVSVIAPGAAVGAGWKAGFVGIGAASLGLVGASIDVQRQPVIYEAPKGERRK